MNNLAPNYLSGNFQQRSNIHERNTRQKNDLDLPKCRLKASQRSFVYRGAKIYNNLSKEIKDVDNLKLFKKENL